jgi:hypothetical protein
MLIMVIIIRLWRREEEMIMSGYYLMMRRLRECIIDKCLIMGGMCIDLCFRREHIEYMYSNRKILLLLTCCCMCRRECLMRVVSREWKCLFRSRVCWRRRG